MRQASAIRRRLQEVCSQFGKVGLLIDDAQDANSRAARELYWAEVLPGWWLQARSVECGSHALRAFIEIFAGESSLHRLRGIVLIDRFLPIYDERNRPMAWDAPRAGIGRGEQEACEEMMSAVQQLMSLKQQDGQGGWFEYELITSYPHVHFELGIGPSDGRLLPWKTRSIEVLFQLRRRLHPSLVRYGPEKHAHAVERPSGLRTGRHSREDEAGWKARAWGSSVEGLAKAMAEANEATPIVLFTGAGASLAQGTYGAGMPPTWWLLEETCRAFVHDPRANENPSGRLRDPEAGPPPREEYYCCHEAIAAPKKAPISFLPGKGVAPIDWLINYLLNGESCRAYDLQCRLETIFSLELNRKSRRDERMFYEYFRSHMEHFDHGVPYHHWLLMKMPWTRIITTNFDSFHERAAFAAAADSKAGPKARQDRLALGSVLPELTSEGYQHEGFTSLAKSFRLFKPYGNLLSPTELALGAEKLADFKKRLSQSFHGLEEAQRGWLVVVGHAMKDAHISDALKALDGEEQEYKFRDRFELLWVDPEAYQRCAPIVRGDGTHRSTWEEWIHAEMEKRERDDVRGEPSRFSGPLPGTALEFTYDLWTEYQSALRARMG